VNVFEQVEVLPRITYKTLVIPITPAGSDVANRGLSASMAPLGVTSERSDKSQTELAAWHHDMANCMQLIRMHHMQESVGDGPAYSVARFMRPKDE